jgi:hypothetical protein
MKNVAKKWAESRLYKRDTVITRNAGIPGRVLCIYKMKKSIHRIRKLLRAAKYRNRYNYTVTYLEYWEMRHVHGHHYYYINGKDISYCEPANKAQFYFHGQLQKHYKAKN